MTPASANTQPDLSTIDTQALKMQANCIRALAMDAVETANSGHPGMPMGMADVATVLFTRHLTFYPHNPRWANRDRFILSAGHGSMLLYALSYLTGYTAMTMDDIKKFRQLHSRTPGHPEVDVDAGIEMTTGPLGQGLSTAVGFALAERILHAKYNDLIDHKTYVIASDGDMQEGITHEACALAGHWKLKNLVVLYDDNSISIDGPTSLSFSEDVCARFNAYGWATKKIDGHDFTAIDAALEWAKVQNQPVLIACKTTIGFGAPNKANTADCHGSPLGKDEIAATRAALNWPHAPFEIPSNLLNDWRAVGMRCRDAYETWEQTLAKIDDTTRQKFIEEQAGAIPASFDAAIKAIKEKFAGEKPTIATRKSSQLVLDAIVPALPALIGGSADLTPSNLTSVKGFGPIQPPTYEGRYIHFGIREHGMAAIMNGLSLHGGLIPYGGTFLTFTDYCRPAIRLAAIMKTRAIYVMTHDSIGLGEDGPTHQPVEHLAALRAIPNVRVFRPCDAIETAECWELAVRRTDGPSILCLTRQNVKPQRVDVSENKCARGAYILKDAVNPKALIWATGSEVEIAMDAATQLDVAGIPVRVISAPCLELFRQQGDEYKQSIFGDTKLKVAIEAGISHCWDHFIDWDGTFIGMNSFGESAPAKDLYKHFGITAENVVKQVQAALG